MKPIRSIHMVACVILVASPLAAQQRHTITHEDVFLMKRISSPAISPDGRWVVFSVTEPSYTEGDQVSDLWLVPSDASAEPRRLTNTKGGESGVDWSPDSRRIAFSARREGADAAQIYVLDLSGGGEAQRVTSISTGASSPLWRPDGRAILFSSMIYPGAATDSANRAAAAERRARKYNARVYDASPIRLWDHWLDDRRPHLFVQSLERGAQARDLVAGSQLIEGAGFGGQLGNSGEDLSATWTPDGSGVVFAATTNRGDWTHGDVVQALWLVAATGGGGGSGGGGGGGEPRRLTQGKDDYDAPHFSPDGKTLYAVLTPTNERTFNNRRLVASSWPLSGGAAMRVVTGGADHSVGTYTPAPDNRTVFFLAEDAGHQRLFRAPSTGGKEQEVGSMTGGTFGGLRVASAASGAAFKIAAVWESATNPAEIVRIDPATGRWTALTKFNTERAAKIDWQPLREFWFTSIHGKRIHSFYALPPGFDSTRSYPLFVLIHGGAANMWTDNFGLRWNPHLLGAPGYVVLMTDYTGSTGYGEKFSQDIQFDPLEGPANDLNEAADSALKRFRFIDASRQIAGGASYGGHLTNWLAVTTTRYRALVSHAGEWDLETQWATSDFNYDRERNVGGPPWEDHPLWRTQSPMRRAAKLHTPVLVSVGERDFRVPMNNALEFWTALQRLQIPSRLIIWPEENHWILKGEDSRFFYKEVAAWFARWLGAPAATGQ
jgi:dipeptidyl aminopeptidase/acylaminoacyl peptidase